MAYDAAKKHYRADGINRILLATDGDFNVGLRAPEAPKNHAASAGSPQQLRFWF